MPPGIPLLGHIPQMAKSPLDFIYHSALNYGDVVRFNLGPQKIYLISNPDYIQHILQDNYKNFRKGYDLVKPVTGNGLIASEGDFWKQQRKMIQPDNIAVIER